MDAVAAYAGLVASAFLSATLLPAQSEVLVAALLLGGYEPVLVITAATLANVAGSTTNWWLGRRVQHYLERRWYPLSPYALRRATGWYQRYGCWSLLLSWLPIVGDPLTLAAGVMREPLWRFLAFISSAKLARYLAVALLVPG